MWLEFCRSSLPGATGLLEKRNMAVAGDPNAHAHSCSWHWVTILQALFLAKPGWWKSSWHWFFVTLHTVQVSSSVLGTMKLENSFQTPDGYPEHSFDTRTNLGPFFGALSWNKCSVFHSQGQDIFPCPRELVLSQGKAGKWCPGKLSMSSLLISDWGLFCGSLCMRNIRHTAWVPSILPYWSAGSTKCYMFRHF